MKEHSGNVIGKKMADEKYNFLFEKAAIPAVLTKLPENIFVEINESFQKIFGYSKNEVIGKTSLELGFVRPEEKEQTIRDIQKHGFGVDLEKHVYTKSGNLRVVLINVNAFKWNDQEFAITTLQDISDRKIALQQAQDKLIVSENTLKLFVEYAPASIAMFDREMKYLAVSTRFIADYQLKNRDIIGLSHYEVFPEIDENWKSIHRRCLAGATEKEDKDPFMRKNGYLDWIQWEIHPWYEKSGQIGGIVLFSEVITERIKAEEELLKSEKRFRTTLETMLEGCQIMDFNWRYVYLNHAAEIHNHIPTNILLGRTYTEVWPGIEKTNVYSVIKSCLEKRTVTHMENEFTYPDGAVGWFELSIHPVPEGVLILSIDITERKKAEEKLTEALEELELRVIERTKQLEAANKELEAFSYSVSHDLRAPLRAMSGFARILEESYSSSLDEEGNRVVQIITSNAKKMGMLIDDLLAFSRLGKQETNTSIINMQETAESVYNELCSEKEKKNITFILHPLLPAYGDASMIKHVLANLVGNAIKFSSLKEHRVIEIDSYVDGMENIYSVKDNGAGFNMKYVSKLFGVFQRLHSANQFEGTGVGLAIVQRIIHRLNGRVWAEGIVNESATFYFTLPNQANDDSGK